MSLISKPEPCDARHDHLGRAGIASVEQDMALGPGDEEGRDVVCANVVEVACDAERRGGLLPASLCRHAGLVQPATEENRGENGAQSGHPDQHPSFGEIPQTSISGIGAKYFA